MLSTMLSKTNLFKSPNIAYLPFTIGGTIGAFYGFRYGYYKSKHKNFLSNVVDTTEETIFYSFCGTAIGGLWPISLPVIFMRMYERKRFDLSVFDNNSDHEDDTD
jgi:hypothetical protein